ncbi:lipoyl synthase [Sodalis-like secondary symbiont of Drepanosiphum platanoidis]|uniref:lipoyl synthase n=1 Tax=Sodalis-like secondary symbiont of Drepanosiphum platanoidis TaxID=2994493 RepID=UPI003464322B
MKLKNKSIKIKKLNIKNISSIPKPSWIKTKAILNTKKIKYIKKLIKINNLNSVCEQASCPNLTECFNYGITTFMILGSICTRKCPFCNIKNGRPKNPDINEPKKISYIIKKMKINHVVITSVNRDDLHDRGAYQFYNCIKYIRINNPSVSIEILVPDFRKKIDYALKIINMSPPDIFNHNLENVPRLYKIIRPGSNYKNSLKLLLKFKLYNPNIPTKSGLMLGLGEKKEEILNVMNDLRCQGVTMLTLGQYMQPTKNHLPVKRYISPKEFIYIKNKAKKMGFINVASGPFVRSSYHADLQLKGIEF